MLKNLDREIENYVESKRNIWSDRTLSSVRFSLRTLAPYLGNPNQGYHALLKRGLSRYTIKTYFIIGSRFEQDVFRSSKIKKFLSTQRTAFKNCYKEKTRLLKVEEFEKFLSLYRDSNPSMYNLLVLMGGAGLRVSEALNATWEDLHDGFIRVVGKGNKQRLVPFEPEALHHTPKQRTGRIVGTLAFRFLFKRDLAPFTPHDFRAFYATNVATNPALSIKDAAFLLGHSNIATTSRYVRTDLNRIANVLSGRKNDQQGIHRRD